MLTHAWTVPFRLMVAESVSISEFESISAILAPVSSISFISFGSLFILSVPKTKSTCGAL